MYQDEIVDEVRAVRDEIARQYDYDISRICEAMRERQKSNGRNVVDRSASIRKIEVEEMTKVGR